MTRSPGGSMKRTSTTTPEQALAAALRTWWYAERPLIELGGDNLDDVLANDARIILAALAAGVGDRYTLVSDAELGARIAAMKGTHECWDGDNFIERHEELLDRDDVLAAIGGRCPSCGVFLGGWRTHLAGCRNLTPESSNAK